MVVWARAGVIKSRRARMRAIKANLREITIDVVGLRPQLANLIEVSVGDIPAADLGVAQSRPLHGGRLTKHGT